MYLNANFKNALKINANFEKEENIKQKRINFVHAVKEATSKSLTPKTITSSLEESGLFPFDPIKILKKIPVFTPSYFKNTKNTPRTVISGSILVDDYDCFDKEENQLKSIPQYFRVDDSFDEEFIKIFVKELKETIENIDYTLHPQILEKINYILFLMTRKASDDKETMKLLLKKNLKKINLILTDSLLHENDLLLEYETLTSIKLKPVSIIKKKKLKLKTSKKKYIVKKRKQISDDDYASSNNKRKRKRKEFPDFLTDNELKRYYEANEKSK
jgi:hypothetical protein